MLDVRTSIFNILQLAGELKSKHQRGEVYQPLKTKSLAMIFEKPSTRTRVAFEVAMTTLGGHALYLSSKELQLGRGESIADTAKVLSRYVDIIMYRAFDHKLVEELARYATVPVINGLDNLEHPCQTIADLFTILEHKGSFKDKKLTYVGDGNNVCNSLLLGCAEVGMDIAVGCPREYMPDAKIVATAETIAQETDCNIDIYTDDPQKAVTDADIIYTDVWVSMGDEAEQSKRERIFRPYQVNFELLKIAKPDCIVMHCLPAHRGYEITDDVIDSAQSIVFDQAENRLHTQKAIILWLLNQTS
jgi:ornithine carbamoyltransferase